MSKTLSDEIARKLDTARAAFRQQFAGAVIGTTGRQGAYLTACPDDNTIKQMHNLATEHGVSLRVHMPGVHNPVPAHKPHINVYVTQTPEKGLTVEDQFHFG